MEKDENSALVTEEEKEERCSSCLRFPRAVYFIVLIELCERFNYYGMRTILILYLTQHLLIKENNAVSLFHAFIFLCYITTILGSYLADNVIGRYKTLVIISVVYVVGSALMSITAIPDKNLSGPIISLVLIAFGTGGVKACVGPFGGDQIPPEKHILLDSYFSMFYFAINFGAFMSTVLTPILRVNVACNGSDDCYPLAFGVPAILMGVAFVLLIAGKSQYKELEVKDSIYLRSIRCIIVAIRNWYRERRVNPKKKLLDYASNEYDEEFISDLRVIYRILIVYLPLPVYWALYDQIGSKWTLQASTMDGEVASKFFLLPDQMSLLNVILIMGCIPIFDGIIYPTMDRISKTQRPLRRMVVGIAITALSFFVAFILQNRIEARLPVKIAANASRMVLVNGLPCHVNMYLPDGRSLNVSSYQPSTSYYDVKSGPQQVYVTFTKCSGLMEPPAINTTVVLHLAQMNFLVVEMYSTSTVVVRNINDFHLSNIKGHPLIRVVAPPIIFNNYQFQLKNAFAKKPDKTFAVGNTQNLYTSNWETITFPGRYLWTVQAPIGVNNSTPTWIGVLIFNGVSLVVDPIKIRSSQVTLFYMTQTGADKVVVAIPLPIHNGAQISMLWQIPQYILISMGEILVSITGLSFSYDQAPASMKSLVNALWFLAVAGGNVIVMIVVEVRLVDKQSFEFLIFAILCVVFDVIFAILTYFYKTREEALNEREIEVTQTKDSID